MPRKPRRKILLAIKDVAELLNVSESTVRNLVKTGELRAPKKIAGRMARWFRSDVKEYLMRLKYQR